VESDCYDFDCEVGFDDLQQTVVVVLCLPSRTNQ